jgi:hypothetical protein
MRRAWFFPLIVVGACGARTDLGGRVIDASVVDVAKGDAFVGGCVHAIPPSRPTQDDDGGAPNLEIYDAVRTIDLGDGGAPVGLDLDQTCTCPQPDSCTVPDDGGPRCDQHGGVDDTFGDLVQTISIATSPFDQKDLGAKLGSGAFGLVIQLQQYSGQANDTQVELAVYASAGTANGTTPQWDGSDVWTLDPNSLLGGVVGTKPVPKTSYDLNAYVADFTLVGSIADLEFVLGGLPVSLTGAIVTATLEPSGGSFRMTKGTLAGRWASRKLVTSLQAIRDPADASSSLCGANATYQLLKNRICALQDIGQNPLDDNKGSPCDAISFAFAFEGVPAKYGSALGFDGGLACGPTWSDQCP